MRQLTSRQRQVDTATIPRKHSVVPALTRVHCAQRRVFVLLGPEPSALLHILFASDESVPFPIASLGLRASRVARAA